MKAFTYYQYGGPEVLQLEEMEPFAPDEDEVQIKVGALSINPAEYRLMTAEIWLLRLSLGLQKPKEKLLGADLAGVVTAVGSAVTKYQVGDRVFGRSYAKGLAEYALLKEEHTAHLPVEIDFPTAAALPIAGITALQALRDAGQIQSVQQVLINGASGGVGTMAVQLAVSYGAEVTGVCSGRNEAMVQRLGADHTIDYTKHDFCQSDKCYDLILDLVGNRSADDLSRVLKPQGRAVMVGFTTFKHMMGYLLRGKLRTMRSGQSFHVLDAKTNTADLDFLAERVLQEELQREIEKTFSFDEIPQAFEHLGTGRTRGKLVIVC